MQPMLRMSRAAGAFALLAGFALAQGDPAKDIKSKDAEKRVAAVDGLQAQGGPEAEKLLVGALLDRDWEVVEKAALALRTVGTKSAVASLVRTALDAPAARIRRAAALALAQIDAATAADDLAKQVAGKNATRAWLALAIVAPRAGGAAAETLSRHLKKSQKSKELAEQLAAAGALAGVTQADRLEALAAYLGGADIGYAVAALRSLASRPEPEALPLLLQAFNRAKLDDVLERRLIATVAACGQGLGTALTARVVELLDSVCGQADANIAARGMRLAEALARVEGQAAAVLKPAALAALERGLSHPDDRVRAAALHAGGRLRDDTVLRAARVLAARDPQARVRLVALRQLVEQVGLRDKELFDLAVECLKGDRDALVREEAAVALAQAGTDESAAALAGALGDPEWSVAACAAVSLGKTTRAAGLEPLLALSKNPEWKRRGAAIVGLCHLTKADAVPAILAALADAEPAIARTAWAYAKALTKQDLPLESAAWQKWWGEHGQRLKMWTPEELEARRAKYGYALGADEVFKDLDVIVLDSRGDHIQKLLEHEHLAFRTTGAAKHKADGLHPNAVYVSNCTGEVERDDIERIAWFVRTGGYLFGSCWSLHETIEKVYPGVVRKFETSGEVSDTVDAEPCAPTSSYLKGVFDGGVEPQYNLEGAHLIEVLERERCEVLVDSPACATRWGSGNLAVWFRAGHGLILDSVNHFDNQGLTNATFLREPEERQAYALDRMGLPYSVWRATQNEKWWSSNTKAAERVFDRTALSLVVNFVRSKRLEEM